MARVPGRRHALDHKTLLPPAQEQATPLDQRFGEQAPEGRSGTMPQVRGVDVTRDEDTADAARRCYRAHGIEAVPADERIAPMLGPCERVYAVRREVRLDRRRSASAAGSALLGDLYVTSARVILVGRPTVAIDIEEIREAALSGDRLLLMMQDGTSAALDVDEPRLLRVQISAARAARRRADIGATTGVQDRP